MLNTLIGSKVNMGSRFREKGNRIPVTTILTEPNVILFVKENKVQLGLGRKKKVKKTENAFVKVAGFAPRIVKEAKINKSAEEKSNYSVGEKVTVSIFKPGDLVKVTGITKGKGFAGSVKRWGFAGGPKTHGQSNKHRSPGSIGQTTTPGRVFKGKKMAGHMGSVKKTVINLEVIDVDIAKNMLVVKGAVPGANKGFLVIERTGKKKGYTTSLGENEAEKKPEEVKMTDEGKTESPKETKGQDQKEVKDAAGKE